VSTAIQVAGSLLILAAFVGAQMRRLTPTSTAYLVMNVVGSGVLAVNAVTEEQWGFLLLEVVWFAVSGWALLQKAWGIRDPAAPAP
jgi:hypothetical protein